MLKGAISGLEVIFIVAAVVFAILWVSEPTGNFEPPLALCSILVVALDFIRRLMRSSELRVFLSVGATYTIEQEDFVKSFERFLVDNRCKRLVVGRDSPAARQPILQVRDLMGKADAVVVLAFTRYIVASAIEKPGANLPKHKSTEIRDLRYPTVWNQIEAAIAFGLKRPLLVIVEDGLRQEAMLKDRLEFKAILTNIDSDLFDSQEFKSIFADFAHIARRRSWLRL
jgi:hypothetical protein